MANLLKELKHEIPMTNPLEEPHIDCRIKNLVQEHWNAHGTPMLLSQLGSQIRPEDAKAIKNESENLAAYLRDRLANSVEVMQSSEIPAIIAAVPANVMTDSNIDIDAALSRTRRRVEFPRFHPSFWAAFVKKATPQSRRYVSVGPPPPRFQELRDDTPPSTDGIEVSEDYIVGSDDNIADVHSSIKRWLIDHNLNESLFLADGESRRQQRLPPDDLLGRLIMALNSDDLKRMPIPLDIVSKLRQKSV